MRCVLALVFTVVLGVAEMVPAFADDGTQLCQYLDGTIVHLGPGSCDSTPYWREH